MRVICKSGIEGFQDKLQNLYSSYEEFVEFSNHYDLAIRLGYKTNKGCWKANPTIQGSVLPSDYCKVK